MNRLMAAEQLRRALQLFTATLSEDKALEIASVYPAWASNSYYKTGDIISHGTNPVGDPQLYKVAQDHMSQGIYPPGEGTESLYTAFGLDESGYPIWSQPSGAHDTYNTGDVVNYSGTLYKSIIDGNVWSPDVYPAGWELVEGETVDPEPTPEPEPEPGPTTYPDFVQPTGAHDAYKTGDRVVYNGKVYESTMDGNTWSPDAYPQGWTEVTV